MPKLSEFDQYRKRSEETGQYIYTCPESECGKEFDSLSGWKSHCSKEHGGYTASDVAAAAPEGAGEAGAGARLPTSAASRPRQLSKRSRELNDKVNEAINLCIKHLIDGLSDEERVRLGVLRGEILTAVAGIEFNFDEKIISFSSKWAVLIVIGFLYALPQLPSLKKMIAKIKAGKEHPDDHK